jgi:hypothetical protein
MTPSQLDLIRRYIFGRGIGHGAAVFELCVDTGGAQLEQLAEWPREQIEKAKVVKKPAATPVEAEEPEEPEPDIVLLIGEEAQAYADAKGEPVPFVMRWINSYKKPVSTRPLRVEPSPGQKKPATFHDGAALQSLLDAVLKSNSQLVAAHEQLGKSAERLIESAQRVLDVVTKQKVEPAQPPAYEHVLSPEELEDLRASTELKREAAKKVGDTIDLIIAIGAKVMKLGEPETAALHAVGRVAAGALSNGAAAPEPAVSTGEAELADQ